MTALSASTPAVVSVPVNAFKSSSRTNLQAAGRACAARRAVITDQRLSKSYGLDERDTVDKHTALGRKVLAPNLYDYALAFTYRLKGNLIHPKLIASFGACAGDWGDEDFGWVRG